MKNKIVHIATSKYKQEKKIRKKKKKILQKKQKSTAPGINFGDRTRTAVFNVVLPKTKDVVNVNY